MGRKTSVGKSLCVTAMTFALASAAHAASSITFVSGLGNDSNTAMVCNLANPCRSFAAAYTVTSAGGEIVTLGPGGYGPLTITGPLTIAGVDGAGIEVTTGVGITINAGAGNNVVIRNLQINGGLRSTAAWCRAPRAFS